MADIVVEGMTDKEDRPVTASRSDTNSLVMVAKKKGPKVCRRCSSPEGLMLHTCSSTLNCLVRFSHTHFS